MPEHKASTPVAELFADYQAWELQERGEQSADLQDFIDLLRDEHGSQSVTGSGPKAVVHGLRLKSDAERKAEIEQLGALKQ
jgi:hypothetical protein